MGLANACGKKTRVERFVLYGYCVSTRTTFASAPPPRSSPLHLPETRRPTTQLTNPSSPQHLHHHPRPHQNHNRHHAPNRLEPLRPHRPPHLPRILPRRPQRLSPRLQTRLRQALSRIPLLRPLQTHFKQAQQCPVPRSRDGGQRERDGEEGGEGVGCSFAGGGLDAS